ncbi:protein atonal homolog 8-like [Sinocyclocheilus anshuiensis]|uniref:Protein atonal homolog 8 n=1 Tax=Sinocyclocheilus anshuiensis TaxID=1608454 RepID=A0A671SYC1_9TELE|nr:PREDICTED: protein atonal homolog 8-like [Sinocyclocheilus anshuiensis]
MKNPHLSEILPSGHKRPKRKAREPVRRGMPNAHLAAETETETETRGSRTLASRDDGAFSAALDMRINAAPDSRLGEQPVSGRSVAAQERALPQEWPRERAIQQTRRLLANARERTRVHTISAAFEALRKQVPCYSYGQKLSKLAILRIACNYILSLAQLADLDYSPDQSKLSFRECVEQCTRTLQAEGRSKKRKE